MSERHPSAAPRGLGGMGVALAVSLLLHLGGVALVGALVVSSASSRPLAPQAGAPDPEVLVAVVTEPTQPQAPPYMVQSASAPKPKPKPRAPLPPAKPAEAKRLARVVQKTGLIAIDLPIDGPDEKPPPDTKFIGLADRHVDTEEQPRIRSLSPSTTARRAFKAKEAAASEPGDRGRSRVDRTERPRGAPEGTPPRPRAPTTHPARRAGKSRPRARQPALKAAVPVPAPSADGTAPAVRQRQTEPKALPDDGPRGDDAVVDLAAAMRVDPEQYAARFGQRDAAGRRRVEGAPRRFLGGWQERSRRVRASLESFATGVKYGNQLRVSTRKNAAAAYIATIHRMVHRRWAFAYLRHLDLSYPMSHPLSNPALAATVEFVIDGKSGAIVTCNLFAGSGELEYDAEALRICYDVAPRKPAPESIISPDGKVYLHWNFWRNTRQCGMFGVSIFVLDDGGQLREPSRRAGAPDHARVSAGP